MNAIFSVRTDGSSVTISEGGMVMKAGRGCYAIPVQQPMKSGGIYHRVLPR